MLRFFSLSAVALLVSPVFSPSPSFAQNQPTPRRATVKPSYLLGVEDTLRVIVNNHPTFSLETVIVPSDGRIVMPVIGSVNVAGRTIAQVDEEITRRFRVRLRRPEITITLVKARPRLLYVTGRVKNAGIVEFRDGWRINQALTAAGGTLTDAVQSAVSVTRGGKTILDTPLGSILRNPTVAQNIALREGDTLRFYERNLNVTISGAVQKPGTFALPLGTSLVELVSQAGGPLPLAALSKTQIRRASGGVVSFDLRRALSDGTAKTDFALREGDSVVVPELRERVAVQGAVEKPGLFPLTDGQPTRVADVVALAGGVKPNAALSSATIRRVTGQVIPIDLYPVLVGGQKSDVSLKADDLLAIPELQGIYVTGDVSASGRTPGPIYVQPSANPRVLDVIALAGGLKSRPEDSRINIARVSPQGKVVTLSVDPVALYNLKDFSQNARVLDGDRISVSTVQRAQIAILGEVAKPGVYEINEGDSVPEVIALAGGPTPDAALSKVSISRRGGAVEQVNLVSAIKNGTEKIAIPLNAGDSIVLPRTTARVLVLGAVNKPGETPLPENEASTVGSAISLAGGTRANANLKQIVLQRQTAKGVERKLINAQSTKTNELSLNTPLQKGDILVVAETTNKQSALNQAISIISTFGFLLR